MAFPRLRRGFDSLHPLHFIIKHLRHQFPQSFPRSPFSTCARDFRCLRAADFPLRKPTTKNYRIAFGFAKNLLTQNHEEQTTADTICLGDADWPFSDPASRDFVPRSPCVDCRHIPFSLPPTARRNLAGTIISFPPVPTCLLVCENVLAIACFWGEPGAVMRLPDP